MSNHGHHEHGEPVQDPPVAPERAEQERNSGVAIALLAGLVVLLLLAMVSGMTGVFG